MLFFSSKREVDGNRWIEDRRALFSVRTLAKSFMGAFSVTPANFFGNAGHVYDKFLLSNSILRHRLNRWVLLERSFRHTRNPQH